LAFGIWHSAFGFRQLPLLVTAEAAGLSQALAGDLMIRTGLIAVGGNSLIRAGETGPIAEQLTNARRTAAAIVGLIREGWRLVVTHGNGPQVGAQLLRSEAAVDQLPGETLDMCGAATQGEIGYLLAHALREEVAKAHLDVPVASVITQTVVSADDPAMQRPTKPIGPFYARDEAERRKRLYGWTMVQDSGRGYRRVVPSPEPVEIIETDVIRSLLDARVLVIACGGGGIPMVRRANGLLAGVEAVIDKDRASALLASDLGVEAFIISTDTQFVFLDYGKPTQRALREITATELQKQLSAGQFPPGSMGPKVESALRFLRNGGREVVITSYEYLLDAMRGTSGTHVTWAAADGQRGTPPVTGDGQRVTGKAAQANVIEAADATAPKKAMAAAAGAGALGRAGVTRIEPCQTKYRRSKRLGEAAEIHRSLDSGFPPW
jgi:carbamate kinase